MSGPALAAGATSRGRPGRPPRLVGLAVLVVVLFLAVVALTLATTDGPGTTTPLDPANPGPDGTRALYRVLADQGVETEVARGADALDETPVDEGTVVVVSSTEALGATTIARLRRHAAPGSMVLLAPEGRTWGLLGGEPAGTVRPGPTLSAECRGTGGNGDLVALVEDLVIEVDRATVYSAPGCFPSRDGAPTLLLDDDLVVLGAARALTNDQVLRSDNAALGLRLLGRGDRLVWYVPDLADQGGEDAVGADELLPRWLTPALWLGLATLGALVLWRGRRLGALVTEPLPVVVRASETTRSRGRLYRRAGDRAHAAGALRAAARDRTAEALGLGSSPGPDHLAALVRGVAARTARSPAEVAALLSPDAPAPGSDHDLITLAQDLDQLDREVRHR